MKPEVIRRRGGLIRAYSRRHLLCALWRKGSGIKSGGVVSIGAEHRWPQSLIKHEFLDIVSDAETYIGLVGWLEYLLTLIWCFEWEWPHKRSFICLSTWSQVMELFGKARKVWALLVEVSYWGAGGESASTFYLQYVFALLPVFGLGYELSATASAQSACGHAPGHDGDGLPSLWHHKTQINPFSISCLSL